MVQGKWASLWREMDVFKDPGSTHEQIHEAGLKIVAAHFSTDQNCVSEKLNEAREIQFHKKWVELNGVPTDYGWEIKDGLLEPIPMQQDPAPVCLMEVAQCKCKATKCTSGRCSCYHKLLDV